MHPQKQWLMTLVAGLALFVSTSSSFADDPQSSLDEGQKAVVTTVTDKIVEDILALRGKYPELEHFGEAPWFTRGLGEFRYENKIDKTTESADGRVKILPGGCGMFFGFYAAGKARPATPYDSLSIGGARAGIAHQIGMTVDDSGEKFQDAIAGDPCAPPPGFPGHADVTGVITRELDTLFEKLAAEYLLGKNGVTLDLASLLRIQESEDASLSEAALIELRFRKLDASKLSSILKDLDRFKHPLPNWRELIRLFKEQNQEHLPEMLLRLTKVALLAEKEGTDSSYLPKPSDDDSNNGDARQTRREIIGIAFESGDEKFADIETLMLEEDPVSDNRRLALDYFAKLSNERGRSEIIKALRNSYRTVQAKAAELAGQKGFTEAKSELERLLDSHSSKVRGSARQALLKLGFPAEERLSHQTLPETAKQISTLLLANGLTEDDIVRICRRPMEQLFPDSERDPVPLQSQFPLGVQLKEREPTKGTDKDGVPYTTRNWEISLKDPWRMSHLDAKSAEKRAIQYAVGFGLDHSSFLDPTGPFLFAGALEANNLQAAEATYERMCDLFDTDDEILDRGLTGLAWERLLQGLHHYWLKEDAKALRSFGSTIRLKELSKPASLLDGYIKQSESLTAEIERRQKEKKMTEPPARNQAAYIKYWVGKIKDINGVMPGQPASPSIWSKECKLLDFRPRLPFASDKLRAVGLPALPGLMEVIEDKTPTRTIMYWRDFWPERGLRSVGWAAREIIETICKDYGVKQPSFLERDAGGDYPPVTPALRKEFDEWFAQIRPGTRKLSEEERR